MLCMILRTLPTAKPLLIIVSASQPPTFAAGAKLALVSAKAEERCACVGFRRSGRPLSCYAMGTLWYSGSETKACHQFCLLWSRGSPMTAMASQGSTEKSPDLARFKPRTCL